MQRYDELAPSATPHVMSKTKQNTPMQYLHPALTKHLTPALQRWMGAYNKIPAFVPDISHRDAQYTGTACVRELAASGPLAAAALRSTGVPSLVSAALDRFAGGDDDDDQDFRVQAKSALRLMSPT